MKKGSKSAQKSVKKGSFLTLFFHSSLKIVFLDKIDTFWNLSKPMPISAWTRQKCSKKGDFLTPFLPLFWQKIGHFSDPKITFFFEFLTVLHRKTTFWNPTFFNFFWSTFWQNWKISVFATLQALFGWATLVPLTTCQKVGREMAQKWTKVKLFLAIFGHFFDFPRYQCRKMHDFGKWSFFDHFSEKGKKVL